MSQLSVVVWGLLLVVVDVRFDSLDVVPDPIGWLLALAALASLGRVHRAFSVASAACAVGLAVSLPDWLAPGNAGVETVVAVAESVVVFATCTGVMAAVPEKAASADRIRWWDLGLSVALVLGLLAASQEGLGLVELAPLLLAIGLAGLVVFVCFLVLLVRAARFPSPAGPPARLAP